MKKIIINIGRQFGSGGKSVANALGERLGITVYDQELISRAAEKSGISPELFSHSDEKKRSFNLSSIFDGMLNDGELFRIQSETIKDIASSGSAIFVGRASNYVLRDMDCLDVFIHAPQEVRVKRVMERQGISADEAASLMEKKDTSRAEYYNFFTFGHWGKASDYDLCIDSSILGVEGTADFIIDFCRRTGMVE
ncbi:MAG: cytidylate kinase-like family protein [Bacteroidales bacterium]|nr:cytidylate kinase-like family protein [Candidatus Cryptobacteroides equifaecalis]